MLSVFSPFSPIRWTIMHQRVHDTLSTRKHDKAPTYSTSLCSPCLMETANGALWLNILRNSADRKMWEMSEWNRSRQNAHIYYSGEKKMLFWFYSNLFLFSLESIKTDLHFHNVVKHWVLMNRHRCPCIEFNMWNSIKCMDFMCRT